MSPQHDPTEFPEPTYKEAVEGWQHCQTVNTELLEALGRIKQRVTQPHYGLTVKEAVMIHDIARAAIKAAKGD